MKRIIALLVMVATVFGVSGITVSADANPPLKEIKEMISTTAVNHDIPPEILKAISFKETGYKQFNADGTPIISDDGGIGIMQITPENIDIQVHEEQLKNDIAYNIDIAAQVLNNKWELSFLPEINDMERDILENWYFAIMAYNGLSTANDPNLNPDKTYQDDIYNRIEGSSFIEWTETRFDFPTFDIRYEDGDNTMKFPVGANYTTDVKTPSQQMYKVDDIVYIDERDGKVTLREGAIDSNNTQLLLPYTPLYVTGGPIESPSINNDFNYYHVEGVNVKGYVSSAYLNRGSEDIVFLDPINDERASALAFLSMNGYVEGYVDGSFGSGDNLRRDHVALILDRILDMQMPPDYQLKADDVSENHRYYTAIAKAEYNGYLGVGGEIRPAKYLTRSQMAEVLTRAFGDLYEKPTEDYIFEDQSSLWNYELINQLYYNGITDADPYRPTENVTRSQFALFIYRTLVNY